MFIYEYWLMIECIILFFISFENLQDNVHPHGNDAAWTICEIISRATSSPGSLVTVGFLPFETSSEDTQISFITTGKFFWTLKCAREHYDES